MTEIKGSTKVSIENRLDNIEKRLHNTETMLLSTCAILVKHLPEEARQEYSYVIQAFFENSKSLGAFQSPAMKSSAAQQQLDS